MNLRITSVIEGYQEELDIIKKGLRRQLDAEGSSAERILETALVTLEEITDLRDVRNIKGLLPFIHWLHNNQERPLSGSLGNTAAQGTLNYLVAGIYDARIVGEADAITDEEMEAMLRFYVGNAAQTSEGSWMANNLMLFYFGDRVVECLSKNAPELIAEFLRLAHAGRLDMEITTEAEEGMPPEEGRPTPGQLGRYEVAFRRLEVVAAMKTYRLAQPSRQDKPRQKAREIPSPRPDPAPQQPAGQEAAGDAR